MLSIVRFSSSCGILARKPSRPIFTPMIGTCKLPVRPIALKKVPSPPKEIMKSTEKSITSKAQISRFASRSMLEAMALRKYFSTYIVAFFDRSFSISSLIRFDFAAPDLLPNIAKLSFFSVIKSRCFINL